MMKYLISMVLISSSVTAMEIVKQEVNKKIADTQLPIAGQPVDYSLVRLNVQTNAAPLLAAVGNIFQALRNTAPGQITLNPGQAVTSFTTALGNLLKSYAPLLQNLDILLPMSGLFLKELRSENPQFQILTFLLRHVLALGVVIAHENVEFMIRLTEVFKGLLQESWLRENDKLGLLNVLQDLIYEPGRRCLLYDETNLDSNMKLAAQTALQLLNSLRDNEPIPLKAQSSLVPVEKTPQEVNLSSIKTLFINACYYGKLEKVRDALQLYPSLILSVDERGFDPLFMAVLGYVRGNDRAKLVFEHLLEKNASSEVILEIINKQGEESCKTYGSVRDWITLHKKEKKYAELHAIMEERDKFLNRWKNWVGLSDDVEQNVSQQQVTKKLETALLEADLKTIIRLLDDFPRLTSAIIDNASLLHKVAALFLAPRIEELESRCKKLLGNLTIRQARVCLGIGEKGGEEKLLFLQERPTFWQHAKARKIPAELEVMKKENNSYMKIWSYLLQVGVPLDITDSNGLRAEEYFSFVETMANQLNQFEAERNYLGNPKLDDMLEKRSKLPQNEQNKLLEVREKAVAVTPTDLAALHFINACYFGKLEKARDALQLYPSLILSVNERGFDPLFMATIGYVRGHDGAKLVFEYLLEKNASSEVILKVINKQGEESYKTYGSVRDFITLHKYAALHAIMEKQDKFLNIWKNWVGLSDDEEPEWQFTTQMTKKLETALLEADLKTIICLLDNFPRLTFAIIDNASLLHKVAALFLAPRIEELESRCKKLLGNLTIGQARVCLGIGEKGGGENLLFLEERPTFWEHAKARKIPAESDVMKKENDRYMKIWSYLLQVGVPLDITDSNGLSAEEYFSFVETMANQLNQFEAERIFLGNPKLEDMLEKRSKLPQNEQNKLLEVREKALAATPTDLAALHLAHGLTKRNQGLSKEKNKIRLLARKVQQQSEAPALDQDKSSELLKDGVRAIEHNGSHSFNQLILPEQPQQKSGGYCIVQ